MSNTETRPKLEMNTRILDQTSLKNMVGFEYYNTNAFYLKICNYHNEQLSSHQGSNVDFGDSSGPKGLYKPCSKNCL